MTNKIVFEVETSRVLELLSKEIYDSPLALLRENIQNAYDATLMRCRRDNLDVNLAQITVTLTSSKLTISDEGIGMTESELRNNFWKAGSSGKRTDLARESGVIGTFGIGAMANFGVCSKLQVETRTVESNETLISTAEKANLSFSKECIELEHRIEDRKAGTTITVDLDPSSQIDSAKATAYLETYVAYLPVRVLLNGNLISQKNYTQSLTNSFREVGRKSSEQNGYSATVAAGLDANGQVCAWVSSISLQGVAIHGELVLVQNLGQLMGLRTHFGLAPVPVAGNYQLGGIANLGILQPTAGREALSRESIVHVQNLVHLIENVVTELIADTDAADKNNAFLQHIVTTNRLDLAKNVTINVHPNDEHIALGKFNQFLQGRVCHYYTGNDSSLIKTFANAELILLHVAQSNPRRKIHLRYLTQILSIPEVPDKTTLLKVYMPSELLRQEAAFLARIVATLSEDYLLADVEINFADISHNVAIKTEMKEETLQIWLARDSANVKPVLATYYTAFEVFGGFVKDFVRNHVYQHVAKFVPSSTREGVEALARVLQKNRELYRYEESELGDIEPLLGEYLAGDITLADVLTIAKSQGRPSTQIVLKEQVGSLEEAIPDMIQSVVEPDTGAVGSLDAAPPIMREELTCPLKILKTSTKHSQLNSFEMFLGLSDRLQKREGEFFRYPHTTKIIWGGHRIIYIFTDASGTISLYYDIELREPLQEQIASGGMFPTTTLVLKNRTYVPVPNALEPAFQLVEGVKEFFVRFDSIVSSEHTGFSV